LQETSEEASNPAIEQEIENLKEMAESAYFDIGALWNYKGD